MYVYTYTYIYRQIIEVVKKIDRDRQIGRQKDGKIDKYSDKQMIDG